MSLTANAIPARPTSVGSGSTTVLTLRTELSEREALLAQLRARLSRLRGHASVGSAARRYVQAVKQNENRRASEPIAPVQRSQAVSSLLSKWNEGFEKAVEKTVVQCDADVKAAQKTFSKKDHVGGARGTAAEKYNRQKEIEVMDDERLPSWATNQKKKVIKKENARSAIPVVKHVPDDDEADINLPNGQNAASLGNNVRAALQRWGRAADEEAAVLERKNKEEQMRREEIKKEKERQEAREKEERERREREKQEMARRQAEEEAARLAELKARQEVEAAAAAEALAREQERELEELRNLPKQEPLDINQLVIYLEKKIKYTNIQIDETQQQLAEAEKEISL